jgi:hypothetical protein
MTEAQSRDTSCDRCGGTPVDVLWIAGSKPALKIRRSFALCAECGERLLDFLNASVGRAVTRSQSSDGRRLPWAVGFPDEQEPHS